MTMKKIYPLTSLTVLVFLGMLLGMPAVSRAARIEGQITNGTLQKPVANERVGLISHQAGMVKVGEGTTDGTGHYSMNESHIDTREFYLLQVKYRGVDYSTPVKFDPSGNATVNITVYNDTDSKPALRVSSARVIVSAEGSVAHVQELIGIQNPLQKVYRNRKGTFFFHIPPSVSNPTVAAVGLMNMPLPQKPEKGKSPGDFRISYALKPGMNVMMVEYDSNYASQKLSLDNSVAYPIGRIQLFVIPPSLTVKSKLFSRTGQDSRSGAQVYEASNLKAGTSLAAQVSGQPAAATEEANAGQQREQEQEHVTLVPDSITSAGVPLVLGFLLVLLWILGTRLVKEWPRRKAKQEGALVQEKSEGKMDALIHSIADIDELFASGKIPEKQYWKERLELKAKAVAILKTGPSTKSKLYAGSPLHR